MISNAKKADAKNLAINLVAISHSQVDLIFSDDGKGLNQNIKDEKSIFEKGFSTTRSTGLGLYHINNIVKEFKWDISIKQLAKGIEFIITIKK